MKEQYWVFVLLLAGSQAPAQQEHPAHIVASGNVSVPVNQTAGSDPEPAAARIVANFVFKAGIEGLTEVQVNRLAVTNAQSERVRKLAREILDDSELSNMKLDDVALMKNVAVPKQIDSVHADIVKNLSAKQGRAFDVAYLNQTAAAHAGDIVLYTSAAGQADSEIAAYAYRSLPVLKKHKRMAEALRADKTLWRSVGSP